MSDVPRETRVITFLNAFQVWEAGTVPVPAVGTPRGPAGMVDAGMDSRQVSRSFGVWASQLRQNARIIATDSIEDG